MKSYKLITISMMGKEKLTVFFDENAEIFFTEIEFTFCNFPYIAFGCGKNQSDALLEAMQARIRICKVAISTENKFGWISEDFCVNERRLNERN